MKAVVLLTATILAAVVQAGWRDPLPLGKASLVVAGPGGNMRIDPLAANLFRVRVAKDGGWTESGLNRYGILKRDWAAVKSERTATELRTAAAELVVDAATGVIRFRSRVAAADLAIGTKLAGEGYEVRFPLTPGERVYGLGDVSRENIQRRPGRYEIWVKNVNSYIPMPMAVTSKGWGMLMNTTWRNFVDVGQKDPAAMVCSAPAGELDFYIFTGADYRALMDIYTQLTGRPRMLPIFGYGFTYVANENIDMFGLLHEACEFRDRDLPCDVIGLEPGWMEKFYDRSTRKEWNKKRFIFPYWAPTGGHTFVGAMNRMGFKLSLWLCCGYDLFRYEEQCVAGQARKLGLKPDIPADVTETWQDDRITGENKDPRLAGNAKMMYEKLGAKEGAFKEGDLPWFEHLKKFVDQGAQCFKLDGAWQVIEGNGGPKNRKWANGKSDEENHNLYPLVYDKQMARGFEEYTRTRAMVYSAGGYVGVQQFVATWAGDTGGGAKPCASLLNLGMSGHVNQSCDMGTFNPQSLHFGMLQTWSQQNNWAYWNQPWHQRPAGVETFRNYVKLRYRLIPYLYAAAAEANRTGWPVMRSLPFCYPDVPEYDACKTTYLLGPNLLVAAFTDEATVPEGLWYDWRTDERIGGPCRRPIAAAKACADMSTGPEAEGRWHDSRMDGRTAGSGRRNRKTAPEWGGGLYVKAGAVIPTAPEMDCLDVGWNDEWILEAYTGADGTGEIYEDDGLSLAYEKGVSARIPLTLKDSGVKVTLSVGRRSGPFQATAERSVTVRFHGLSDRPASVMVAGKTVDGTWDAGAKVFTAGPFRMGPAGGEIILAK